MWLEVREDFALVWAIIGEKQASEWKDYHQTGASEWLSEGLLSGLGRRMWEHLTGAVGHLRCYRNMAGCFQINPRPAILVCPPAGTLLQGPVTGLTIQITVLSLMRSERARVLFPRPRQTERVNSWDPEVPLLRAVPNRRAVPSKHTWYLIASGSGQWRAGEGLCLRKQGWSGKMLLLPLQTT